MNAVDLLTRNIPAGTWGNLQLAEFDIVLANGDNIASTHDIGILPKAFVPYDWMLFCSDPGPASTTLDIGLKSLSGTNQDDPDYFYAVTAATATGFTRRALNNPPFELAQDMYIRVTVQGANQTGALLAKLVLQYTYRGNA